MKKNATNLNLLGKCRREHKRQTLARSRHIWPFHNFTDLRLRIEDKSFVVRNHCSYLKTHVQLQIKEAKETLPSMKGWSTSLTIRSASSKTRYLQERGKCYTSWARGEKRLVYRILASPTRPRCIRSFNRPGVATSRWLPFSKSRVWKPISAPP